MKNPCSSHFDEKEKQEEKERGNRMGVEAERQPGCRSKEVMMTGKCDKALTFFSSSRMSSPTPPSSKSTRTVLMTSSMMCSYTAPTFAFDILTSAGRKRAGGNG